MLGLETLDVLIGLITVYLSFGMACTVIVEALASWLSVRSKNLQAALSEFFAGELKEGKKFVDAFYEHPLVQALSKGIKGRPSYIPPETVVQVVESLIMTANGAATTLDEAVDKLPGAPNSNRIKGILETFVAQTSNDATAFRGAVEKHFDAVMDRASGWVKRRQQKAAFWIAAVLVIVANVDTIVLATSLASSPDAREKMVAIAQDRLEDARAGEKKIEEQAQNKNGANGAIGRGEELQYAEPATPADQQDAGATSDDALKQAKNQTEAALRNVREAEMALQSAGLPMGWKEWPSPIEWPAKIVGLLVSIFAVSLGAPFWFDVLQRVMRVRQSGVSPREKEDEKN
jgi:hypothetical protein